MDSPNEEHARNLAARKKAAEWLEEKTISEGEPCSVCGQTRWIIADLSHIPAGTKHAASRLYLVVPVVCGNCGYIRLFHAGLMGAVPQDEEGSRAESEEGE